MLSLSLDQLRTLVAVVDRGTFDGAAEQLHITSSAVSQRIRALEDSAGRVLVRRERPVAATDAGEEYLRTARQMLHLEELLGRSVEGADSDPESHLVLPVACNADSLASWFLPALTDVPEHHRAVFDIRREDETHSADLLRRGEVMAAVTSEQAPVQGCRVEALGSMRYRAYASPEFVADHLADGVTRAALGRLPVVDFDRRDSMQARYTRKLTHTGGRGPRHYIPSTDGYQRAVRTGMGWGLLPEVLAATDHAEGRLVDLMPAEPMDVPLYWQSWKVRSDILRDLTVAVRRAAADSLLPPAGAGTRSATMAP